MNAQSADIALCTGSSMFDKGIQFFTHSKWNHVALVEQVLPAQITILEMTGQGCCRTVLPRPVPPEWQLRSTHLDDEQRQDALHWARHVFDQHTRYGWIDIMAILLHILLPNSFLAVSDGRYFCSQFCAIALAHGGAILDYPEYDSPATLDQMYPDVVS